jgi:hypothetical protein
MAKPVPPECRPSPVLHGGNGNSRPPEVSKKIRQAVGEAITVGFRKLLPRPRENASYCLARWGPICLRGERRSRAPRPWKR